MISSLLGLLLVLVVMVLIFGSVALASRGAAKLRWDAEPKWVRADVPEAWRELILEWFPLSRTLPPELFERLLRMVQVFLRDVRFEGAGGFTITERVKLIIAAQACYLIVGLEGQVYPTTRAVVVYPSTFVPSRSEAVGHGAIRDADTPLLGESWTNGTVVLAWDSVVRGAANPSDGRNLIFHEFAHQFDQEDGDAGGIPPGMEAGALRAWGQVLDERFSDLQDARDRGRRTVLSHYGATNPAEFFAVAVEAFYEKPLQLSRAKPDVYEQLSSMFNRDPARELAEYDAREHGTKEQSP